jgi:hypothetical protein
MFALTLHMQLPLHLHEPQYLSGKIMPKDWLGDNFAFPDVANNDSMFSLDVREMSFSNSTAAATGGGGGEALDRN